MTSRVKATFQHNDDNGDEVIIEAKGELELVVEWESGLLCERTRYTFTPFTAVEVRTEEGGITKAARFLAEDAGADWAELDDEIREYHRTLVRDVLAITKEGT